MMTIQHCWWQILVASAVYFALGAIWFNPKVFGTIWQKSHGLIVTEETKKSVSMGKLMGLSFVCALFLSAAVCWVCCATCAGSMCSSGMQCLSGCVKGGLLVGGSATAAISMAYIYQMKPTAAYFTDCGYHIAGCLLAAITYHLLGCC